MTILHEDEILASKIRLEAGVIVAKARVLMDDGDGIFKMLSLPVATENDMRSMCLRLRAHCARIEIACGAIEKLVQQDDWQR